MDVQTIELQRAVVTAVAQAIPSAWERIVASYEVDDHSGGRVENLIVIYVTDKNGSLVAAGLEGAPSTIEAAFFALRGASNSKTNDRWASSEVTIDFDGSYTFSFSYDSPKRINGVFDYDSLDKYENYAEVYAAEKASLTSSN